MIVDDYNVYKLSNIIRYSQQDKIKHETVAEHSFYVAWFVNRLCTKYQLCDTMRLLALETALLHDIPEVITNDITHDVKVMIPGVCELLEPYEKQIIMEHSPRAYKVLFEPETHEEKVARALVKHADVLSVVQYCRHEEALGNKSFIQLLRDTEIRAQKSKAELLEVIKEKGGK